MKKQFTIKKILFVTLWVAIGAGSVVLLVASIGIKDAKHCKGIEINIKGVDNNYFVDKNDILNSITAIEKKNPVGKSIGSFNLKKMETELEKDVWIKDAELFFDNNEMLQVNVYEREPIARIFTTEGTTFYIDHELTMLPLSEKFSARIPVFTNFPSDKKVLSKADSSLLRDIKTVSLAIQKDSFRMAMIEQVDITPQRIFEMIPKIGNQLIVFGDAADAEEKFIRLQLFYKEVMAKAGLSIYSQINVQYKNQVVAKRKDAADIASDAARTLELMKQIAERVKQEANDSLQVMQQDNIRNTIDSSLIQQSIQRDDNAESTNTIEKPKPQDDQKDQPVVNPAKPAVVKATVKQDSKQLKKPEELKKETEQPKAVMPKKNDYVPAP
jgi:cell division protein FtsQ